MINGTMRNYIKYDGREILIDTAVIGGGPGCMTTYETMAMYTDNSMDIDCARTHDFKEAKRNHEHMVEKWQGAEDFRVKELERAKKKITLSGKYAKLRDDLIAAYAETEHLEQTEDGGTCNFDSPVLNLERWNAKQIERAAEEAGGSAWQWKSGRYVMGWVFSPRSSGQGNRRTRRAEAIAKAMETKGYSVGMYYQMD